MSSERRTAKRIKTNLRARWEGVLAQHEGAITDLSINGCFILTVDKVKPRELIRLDFELDEENQIYLWGEVVYLMSEIGFAVRFTGISDGEEQLLTSFIDAVATKAA